MFIFDLLFLEGVDMRGLPLRTRKERLGGILPEGNHIVKMGSATLEADLDKINSMFDDALKEGMEGLVLKDPDARYGAIHSWQKVREEAVADVFVMDFIRHGSGGCLIRHRLLRQG